MKLKLLLILSVLAQIVAMAAPPPVMPIRANPFTTNVPPSRITNQVRLLQTTNAEFSTEVDIGEQLTVGNGNGPGPQTNQIGNAVDWNNIPGLIVTTNVKNGPINVRPFLAADGVTDDAPLLQAVIRQYGDDTAFLLPEGNYMWASPCVITNDRVHIVGPGAWVAKIFAAPTVTNIFTFERTGSIIWQCSIQGVTISGVGNNLAKTAIKVVDSSEFLIHDVIINDWYGANSSIALYTQGRELLRVDKNCRWTADIPVWIGKDPNTSPAGYLSADHFTFNELFLSSTNTLPLIWIEDGVHLSSTMWLNNSWNGGGWGVYWNDTSSLATSEGFHIINSRKEQNFTTNGYSLFIAMKGTQNGGGNLQGLNLQGFTMDGACNGVYLRNVTTATMLSCTYPGAHTFIDILGRPYVTELSWQNMTFLNGLVAGIWRPLVNIQGMVNKYTPGKPVPNDPLPPTAFWQSTITTNFVPRTGTNSYVVSGDNPTIIRNAGPVSGRALEILSLRAESDGQSTVNDRYGARLLFEADDETNEVYGVFAIDGIWVDSATRIGALDLIGWNAGATNRVLSIQADRRVVTGEGEADMTMHASAGGGSVFFAGSATPGAANRYLGLGTAISAGTHTDSLRMEESAVTRVMGDTFLGHSGNLSPWFTFWPDNSGIRVKSNDGNSIHWDMQIGDSGWTNSRQHFFHFVGGVNGTNGVIIQAAQSADVSNGLDVRAANGTSIMRVGTDATGGIITGKFPWSQTVAASDETTAITSGATPKITFRVPRAIKLTAVRADLTTAQTGGATFTIDVKESGTTIFSTKPTIENGETTTVDATTQPVLSDTSLADNAQITVLVDQVGDGTAKGLKVTLIGYLNM